MDILILLSAGHSIKTFLKGSGGGVRMFLASMEFEPVQEELSLKLWIVATAKFLNLLKKCRVILVVAGKHAKLHLAQETTRRKIREDLMWQLFFKGKQNF
jgi:hypothetical protein